MKYYLSLFLLLIPFNTNAVLNIEITQGIDGAIPIGIQTFSHQGMARSPLSFSNLINTNLVRSGLFVAANQSKIDTLSTTEIDFNAIKAQGLDYFVIGKTKEVGPGSYVVSFQLFDVLKKSQLIGIQYPVDVEDMRLLGHKISDHIYEKIIGDEGAFSSQIVYVSTKRLKANKQLYLLNIADSDGFNPKIILSSPEPIMSPSWSPDATKIAYVSFEKRRSTIYVQVIKTGKRKKIVSFDGINGAPSFSPDGQSLAVTLSIDGNAEIYTINLKTNKRQRITKNSSIDTEPTWMPDGKTLVFTSDRSGSPQIYKKSILGGRARRLTFEGSYNASPAISADGKTIALVQGNGGLYQVALLDIETRALRIVSDGSLDESPSFAPNDSMILFGSEKRNSGVFGAVSFDGRMKQIFSGGNEGIREPVWSPFIN